MTWGVLLFFVGCIVIYLFVEWKPLRRTGRASRWLAVGICALSLAIWAYQNSDLPKFYPGSIIDRFIGQLLPFARHENTDTAYPDPEDVA